MQIKITGNSISDFLEFIDEKKESQTCGDTNQIVIKGEFSEGNGRRGGVVLLSLLVSSLAGVITPLIVEFFKSRIQNELTFTKTNDSGGEIKITLKGLSLKEIEQKMEEFYDSQ